VAGRASKRKGKRGERLWAKFLRDELGVWAMPKGGDQDVISSLRGIHFEVKNRERLNIWKAIAQAEHDARRFGDDCWFVAFTRNAPPGEPKQWYVAMDAHLWVELMQGRDNE